MQTNCTINWMEIYPLDSAIHLLNDWGQKLLYTVYRALLTKRQQR